MTNIDPERVQKQEKQVLKKWKSNLEHLLPSLFELLHQLASPGSNLFVQFLFPVFVYTFLK